MAEWDSRRRPAWRRYGRAALLALAIVLAVPFVTGWLYWLRGPLGADLGPRIADVLPLDELPDHADAPLVAFLAASGVTMWVLGVLARRAGLTRGEAALVLAVAVGIWSYLVAAASLYVVRQVPPDAALRAASRVQSVYIQAALAGVAGALVAAPRPREHPRTRMLSWLVGVGGLLNVASVVIPHGHHPARLLVGLAPSLDSPLASALVVPTGVLLLIASRGLGRGSHPAYVFSLCLLAVSAALHVARGVDPASTVLAGMLALLLVAHRSQFTAPAE